MHILKIAIFSVLSILALFGITKMIGYRQLSQMSMFDYINGITIGSMAADMAMNSESKFWEALAALLVYGAFAVVLSKLTNRFPTFRRIMNGKPIVLMYRGRMDKSALAFAKLDLNEFQMQCRNMGYFDMSEIKLALLESNGKLSIMPYEAGDELGGAPDITSDMPVNVIMDDIIMHENLHLIGKNEEWLCARLAELKIGEIKNIFLATADASGKLEVYRGEHDLKRIGNILE